MMRHDSPRLDMTRRSVLDHKRKQFAPAPAAYSAAAASYPHRLNLYTTPPTAEITLEEFEQWAIDRLRILAELEACSYRNRSPAETASHMAPLLTSRLPLRANTAAAGAAAANDAGLQRERQRDHYSHFILRLAFCGTEELRRRFVRLETQLFRLRAAADDARERRAFVGSLDVPWQPVSDDERRRLGSKLNSLEPRGGSNKRDDSGGDSDGAAGWFKVDWETVPDLVESRRVYVEQGQAYVPPREQMSMLFAEFSHRLSQGLELTARALPRLDEDDRLTPILNHLARSFATPEASLEDQEALAHLPSGGPALSAETIDVLSAHFPPCMRQLHRGLRQNAHLRHYGRLQYTLFLKGIGLSLDQALLFWRRGFRNMDDSKFDKEYRYNVRHAYGDVGGDENRRARGQRPLDCQRILTSNQPGPQDNHGCPFRSLAADPLAHLLRSTLGEAVVDRELLRNIKEDVDHRRFHIACTRVFEASHKSDLARARADGYWRDIEAGHGGDILHPNTYFQRSYLLKYHGKERQNASQDDRMED